MVAPTIGAVTPGLCSTMPRSARSYLDYQSFSRQGLIQQLEFEGFTHSQASYGVSKAYH